MTKAGESWSFFLEEGGAEGFLARYGFDLEELCRARDLEMRYFSDPEGRALARVNATHGLAAGKRPGSG